MGGQRGLQFVQPPAAPQVVDLTEQEKMDKRKQALQKAQLQLKRMREEMNRLKERSPSPSPSAPFNAALAFLFGFLACFSLLFCSFLAVRLALAAQ